MTTPDELERAAGNLAGLARDLERYDPWGGTRSRSDAADLRLILAANRKMAEALAASPSDGEGVMSIIHSPSAHTQPLDGALVTTESIGGANPAKRSATFKVAFFGEGCVERVHAAEDYIKALIAADRDAAMLAASPQGEGSSADAHTPQPDAPGWRDIATAPKDGTMLLVGYDEGVAREGAMEDRQRVFEARWNDVQGTWSARNGFLLHSDATHWQPLPHPPSAHPAPIKPSVDTGELRERVAQIIEAAIERHNPKNSLRHTIDDADAILDLIQAERGEP